MRCTSAVVAVTYGEEHKAKLLQKTTQLPMCVQTMTDQVLLVKL